MNELQRIGISDINFDDCSLICLKIKEWRKSKSKAGVRFIPVWREIAL